ncbi:MAG: ABC transporter ATP-binding protein [Candidatus Asgardarchaeia archaeon]
MLILKDLSVKVGKKVILRDINMEVKDGESVVVFGPNAVGKTSLAKTIMGFPGYDVVRGDIVFNGKSILNMSIEERVREGITMVFQDPPQIRNVKLSRLLRYVGVNDPTEFAKRMDVPENLLDRELNVGFSGGEKKLSEIIQVLALNPKLIIFDELDSGLDIEKLSKIGDIVTKHFLKKGGSAIIITHRGDIMKVMDVSRAYVIYDGRSICMGDPKQTWYCISNFGYSRCEVCLSSKEKFVDFRTRE